MDWELTELTLSYCACRLRRARISRARMRANRSTTATPAPPIIGSEDEAEELEVGLVGAPGSSFPLTLIVAPYRWLR